MTRNTGVMLWSEVLVKLFTLSFTIVFARSYGATGLGRWTYAWTVATLVMTVAHFGLATLFTRDAAARPSALQALLESFLPLRFVLVCAGLVASGVAAAFAHDPDTRMLLVVFAASLGVGYLAELFAAVFRAQQRLRRVAAINVVDRAVASLAGCAVALAGAPLVTTALVWSAAPAAAAALAWLWVRAGGTSWRLRWNVVSMRGILREAAPLFVLAAFGQIYFREDVLFLRWLGGDEMVGHYAAAYRVFEMFLFVPASLTSAYLPAAAAARARSNEEFHRVVEHALTLCAVFSVPLAVLLSTRAVDAIHLLFGDGFAVSVPAARVLAWTLVFYFANAVLAHTLISGRRQAIPAMSIVCATVVTAALNLLWIPRLGILAAALATLVTEALICAIYCGVVLRGLVPPRAVLRSTRPLLAGGAMLAVCVVLRAQPVWIVAPAACATYAVLVLALGIVRPGDVRALLPPLRRAAASESRPPDAT